MILLPTGKHCIDQVDTPPSGSETILPLLILLFAPLLTWAFVWFEPVSLPSVGMVSFLLLAGTILYFVPSKTHYGPKTAGGRIPAYPDNGGFHLVAMLLLLLLPSSFGVGWDPTVVADLLPGSILFLNGVAILVCLLLFRTGLSSGLPPDDGSLGKGRIHDFYAGVWLHPRLCDAIDLKLLINSRFSMTLWLLHSVSSLFVVLREGPTDVDWSVLLCSVSQQVYLLGFFLQETHYVHTIDIIEDRAGFYETWGCMVWVPSVYTLHTRVGLRYGSGLGTKTALVVFSLGLVCWMANFVANEQRRRFRSNPTAPLFLSFSKSPPHSICATYTLVEEGKEATSLLLVDGMWGWARHPQYVFDILQSLSWGVLGGGLTSHSLALFYPGYISILLVHRSMRDEERCLRKYGKAYREYVSRVPHRLLPGVWWGLA